MSAFRGPYCTEEERAAVPGTQGDRTQSHLAGTVLFHTGHVIRHLQSALAAPDLDGVRHDVSHAAVHADQILDHARRLRQEMADGNPAIAAENAELDAVTRSAEAQRAFDATLSELRADLMGTSA